MGRRISLAGAAALVTPAVVLGTLTLVWYVSTTGDRWIGPNERVNATDFDPALPAIFAASLLGAQATGWRARGTAPEPLLVAFTSTAGLWLAAKVFFTLGLVFMYAGVAAMFGITAVLALLLLLACALTVRALPRRRPAKGEAAAKLVASLLALAWLLPPWEAVRLKAMPAAERHAAAGARFGAPYDIAAAAVRGCAAIREVTGDLTDLTISPRRNLVESTPYWDFIYFDFDYAGSLGTGRLTISFQHLKVIPKGNPDGLPPQAESFVGGENSTDALVFIYPGYAKSSVRLPCPLPGTNSP